MKKLIPHVSIKNCKEAIEFYQSVLGGEIKGTKLADGIEMFKGHEGKYIHAELHFENGSAIYFNDVFSDNFVIGNNIELSLDIESEEELNRIYQALAEKGQVKMPLDDMFWGAKYGKVTDEFGLTWELNFQK